MKTENLSFAGKNTLIKSVALANPAYVKQVFLLPINICNRIVGFCGEIKKNEEEDLF